MEGSARHVRPVTGSVRPRPGCDRRRHSGLIQTSDQQEFTPPRADERDAGFKGGARRSEESGLKPDVTVNGCKEPAEDNEGLMWTVRDSVRGQMGPAAAAAAGPGDGSTLKSRSKWNPPVPV